MREPRSHHHQPDETAARPQDDDRVAPEEEAGQFGPVRLFARRHSPWLLVEVDGSATAQRSLVWALREAARREATVLAVTVLDRAPDHPLGANRTSSQADQTTALNRLEAQVLGAIAETGVHGRSRTAVLERAVFEALSAAAAGADLVIVGASGKTLLRQAVARPPFRRLPRGA